MKAVILAAGHGKRMGYHAKPLLPLFNIPIIEHTIRRFEVNSIDEIAVVYHAKDIAEYLKKKHPEIHLIYNKNTERDNGYSLYLASKWANADFILVMGDHYFSDSFFKMERFEYTTLIVSENCVDEEEATKVKTSDSFILDIGKKLEDYEYFDTGFFYCNRDLLNYAEKLVNTKKIVKVSDIMKLIAIDRKLKYNKVDAFWIDIDTRKDLKMAEKRVEKNLLKDEDGYIAKYINRKISIKISKFLAKYDLITPNLITIVSLILGIFTAYIFLLNFVVGGILTQITSIFDGSDGELARVKNIKTKFGAALDAISDRYVDVFIIIAIYFLISGMSMSFFPFLLSVTGVILFSYTYHMTGIRVKIGGRDMRLFLIFIFSILSIINISFLFYLLLIIGLLTHFSVIFSVLKKRRDKQ